MSIIRKIAFSLLGVKSVVELANKELSVSEVTNLAGMKFTTADFANMARRLSYAESTAITVEKSGHRNFTDLAARYLSDDAHRERVLELEVRRLIREFNYGARQSSIAESSAFMDVVAKVAAVEESSERNILKRKATAMAAIREVMPELSKSSGNYAVELILQLVKQRKAAK